MEELEELETLCQHRLQMFFVEFIPSTIVIKHAHTSLAQKAVNQCPKLTRRAARAQRTGGKGGMRIQS